MTDCFVAVKQLHLQCHHPLYSSVYFAMNFLIKRSITTPLAYKPCHKLSVKIYLCTVRVLRVKKNDVFVENTQEIYTRV